MTGGLIQLVAYGAQDVYLTGDPKITFFKVIYRHHTHFAIESIEQAYNGKADFSNMIQLTIARNGDLVGPITLEVDVGLNLNNMFVDSTEIGDYKTSTKTADHKGWLLCDGRSLDRRKYTKLFAKIGYQFGGSGLFFHLPNMAGKVMAAIGTGVVQETVAFSLVEPGSDTFTVEQNTNKWITGMEVVLTTTGSAPGGLTSGQTYYVIRLSPTRIKLASSQDNAIQHIEGVNELHLNFSSQGSGSHTLFHTLNTRVMGELGGAETHGLTIAELPTHNHGVNQSMGQIRENNRTSEYTHDHTGNTTSNLTNIVVQNAGSHTHDATDSGHSHPVIMAKDDGNSSHTVGQHPAGDSVPTINPYAINTNTGFANIHVADAGDHTHSLADPTHLHGILEDTHFHLVNPAGSNATHNIMQPTVFGGNVFLYSNVGGPIGVCDCDLRDNLVRWGFQLIDYVELEIGGQIIDKQYGEWMDMWTQLTYSQEKYAELLTQINCSIASQNENPNYDKVGKLYIPLQFWFCRNPGLYIPLIALSYHDIKLQIQLNCKKDVNMATRHTSNVVDITNFNYTTGAHTKTNFIEDILDFRVYCEYVYLDSMERKLYTSNDHEYLIEQVQDNEKFSTTTKTAVIPLKFNHPCKTMIWRSQRTNYTVQEDPNGPLFNDKYFLSNLYDYHAIGGNSDDINDIYQLNSDTVHTVDLELNNKKRFSERDGSYFRIVQPHQWISNWNSAMSTYWNSNKWYGGGFYMYHFGLRVDEHQPSGTVNFSRIDQKVLRLTMNPYASSVDNKRPFYDYEHRVWAVNYNILKIKGGMAGLTYAN